MLAKTEETDIFRIYPFLKSKRTVSFWRAVIKTVRFGVTAKVPS